MLLAIPVVIFTGLIKFSVEKVPCGNQRFSIFHNTEDALCYWSKISDDLPLLDEKNPTEDAIYFIDVSCKGGLNMREACSVEAAAKINPGRKVNVLFAGPIEKQCTYYHPLFSLQNYYNIHLARIFVDKYVNSTRFSKAFQNSIINDSPYPKLFTLNILKYVTLYKFGGIYMDLDMLATRSFDHLPKSKNWVSVEDHSERSISTAIFAASLDETGKRLMGSILSVLRNDKLKENLDILRSALELMYGKIPFQKTKDGYSFTRPGIVLYASKFFFPVHCKHSTEYFDSKLNITDLKKSFVQQICNGMTYQETITEQSTYAKLMKEFCPFVYNYFQRIHFAEHTSNRFSKKEKDRGKEKIGANFYNDLLEDPVPILHV